MALFTRKKQEAPNKTEPKIISEATEKPVAAPEPIQESQPVQPEPATAAPVQEPAKKAPPKRKRSFDHHVWFSGEEERRMQIRAEKAGLSPGMFIRKAALENPIVVDPHKKEEQAAIQQLTAELKFIHSELGKHGGMLKMAIKPNEGQREADPEEWALLVKNNHEAVRIQKEVLKTMEAANGYFKAHQL